MFETILVPIDGSAHADKAVTLASDIAEKYQARLVLLHVLPEGPLPEALRHMARTENISSRPGPGPAPVSPEGKFPASTVFGKEQEAGADEAQEVRRFLAERIMAKANKVADDKGVREVISAIEDGDPTQRILHYAEKEAANLIVMGSRGLSDLKGLLMGSVSHKVSQMSPCSCITVK